MSLVSRSNGVNELQFLPSSNEITSLSLTIEYIAFSHTPPPGYYEILVQLTIRVVYLLHCGIRGATRLWPPVPALRNPCIILG